MDFLISNWVNIALGLSFVLIFYFLRHFLGGMIGLYRVVPVNESHIRILNNKKEIFSSRSDNGKKLRSSYWYIPFITKLNKLPLTNLAVPVNDIKLNDKNMAKFVCDIMCFINISNIELAVERLSLTEQTHKMGFDFTKLSEDLRAIMESIGRTVTTKQTILDIYMNRRMLDDSITAEVEAVFPKWGISLVDLELKDIKDAPESTIIHDIEALRAAEIKRDAEIKIAETTKEAEIAKAVAEETYRKRQIEKDRTIGIAEQQKKQEIARQEAEANITEVEALREIEVGKAEISKEVIQQNAEAQKIKFQVEAEGEAKQITTIGQAEADIIKAKKVAEAEGTLKLAEAMKQYNDTGIDITLINTQKEVIIEKYKALAEAMSKAHIDWIISGENAKDFFGLNLNGIGGANLKQFLNESGLTKDALKNLLDVVPEKIEVTKKRTQ